MPPLPAASSVSPDRPAPPARHRATCRNLCATGAAKGRSATNLPKLCSTDRDEFTNWERADDRSVRELLWHVIGETKDGRAAQ
jgi:hypothetical protein